MTKPSVLVKDNTVIHANKVAGINDLGEMALAVIQGNLVVCRGLMASGGSCIFIGNLFRGLLTPLEVALSPDRYPLTKTEEPVIGYEDPTVLHPIDNFVEPGRVGILCTQAYHSSEHPGWVDTNLFYLGLNTRLTSTVITPKDALDNGLCGHYDQLNLVKEAEVINLAGKPNRDLLFEVGAEGKSRIAKAYVTESGVIGLTTPFLDPKYGTWYSEHVSTAASPIVLDNGQYLLIFNGRDDNTWRVGWMLIDKFGEIITVGEPFLEPPKEVAAGPGGQNIAFASCYDTATKTLYYHAQDRYICAAQIEIQI